MIAPTLEEIREAGLDDFRVCLIQVWAYLRLPPPTPVQLDIAWYLQHGPKRKIIMAFRGVGKSWITVAYVLWRLLLDPQLKIMVVSANESLAQDFTKFCFQLINGMPMLQHLKPDPTKGHKQSSEKFDVGPATDSKDPSVKSVGITGQLTGSRADIIIPDDIEVPKNSYTPLLRERLAHLIKEFGAILKPGDHTEVTYLGTPQNEESVYNKLVAESGYETRIWPARIPKSLNPYGGRLAPFVQALIDVGVQPWEPVDPKRFNDQDLREREIEYAAAGFSLQFMLDTTPSDAEKHPLKLRDLMVMDLDEEMANVKLAWGADRNLMLQDLVAGGFSGDRYYAPAWRSPEMAPYSGTVMAIDPSGHGTDETAYAIVRVLHSTLYLVASGGYRDGFAEETLRGLAAKAARHRVNYVICEENYGGGMFNKLLLPHLTKVKAGRLLDKDEYDGWSRGQKEIRILDTLEPLVKSHRLVVDRRVIEEDRRVQEDSTRYSLIQQYTRLQRIKGALPHDDRIEAVAMACQFWVDKMSQDRDKAVESHREAALTAELTRYLDHVFNLGDGSSSTVRWSGRQ